METHYLMLIERLVREGRSEREIDRTVRRLVDDDRQADVAGRDGDLPALEERRAA